jgi:hypothetical protein
MPFTLSELEAYLGEALPPAEMAAIEQALRSDAALAERLASILARRSAGVVSIGEIWRRERLTCPTREQLGSYLLEALDEGAARYIAFHIETIGCRYCRANLADLENQQAEAPGAVETRRHKYFQSSVGRLRRDE